MIRIYSHPACLAHDPGPGHPESPDRLTAVLQALRAADLPDVEWHEAPQATREQLLRAHAPSLVQDVLDAPLDGHRHLDPDTGLSPGSPEAALRAVGAACAAVDAVIEGHAQRAFCAVRPPGHHATPDTAMGFCLFNAVAVAALHARHAHGLGRIAVVDFDVHHGNGTQDILGRQPGMLYLSSHQEALYPGTGLPDEHGHGGQVRNALLPAGANGMAFRELWDSELLPLLDAFAPELLLVSAGFDAHRLDPLANLNLKAEDFAWLTEALLRIARRHAQGRVVSALEGGYSLAALRECSVAHVRALR